MTEFDRNYDAIVSSNPTWKFFIREAKFDFDKLDHQANIVLTSVKIVISKCIDRMINEYKNL